MKNLAILEFHWGWITPGTNTSHKRNQSEGYLRFLSEPREATTRHFAFTHCGWWLDHAASRAVRNLTGRNPEPYRNLVPCDAATLRALRRHVRTRRLEFIVYPYAACVSEATTGEGLLRSFRLSRVVAEKAFGRPSRAMVNHDAVYALDWTAVQMPQIARLLGFDVLLATRDGWARAPDGTRVRILGRENLFEIIDGVTNDSGPTFKSFELHVGINFHRNFAALRKTHPTLKGFDLRTIPLAEYLKRRRADTVFDSRQMGSKSWYGGCIDALQMEQNAKSVELRLPALEALAVLAGKSDLADDNGALNDIWKKSFILMDNHTLWQCHNYKAHYLPESYQLLDATRQTETRLMGGRKRGRAVGVFNPTPWARDLVVEAGPAAWVANRVPGWGTRAAARVDRPAGIRDTDTTRLSNERVAYTLDRFGAIRKIRTRSGTRRYAGLGGLLRIHEHPRRARRNVKTGTTLPGMEGAFSASCEVCLNAAERHIEFEMTGGIGAAFLLQSESLNPAGKAVHSEWVPLHSLHWGGGGLPRHEINISPRKLAARTARMRITLWMLAEGSLRLGVARVRVEGKRVVNLSDWVLTRYYRNAYTEPKKVNARVVRSTPALKVVRFTGALPDLTYVLEATLRQGSETLEYRLNLTFPKPTPLGLSSPPFRKGDGSILGAQCERPYVPGVAVLLPLPGKADYYADQPFYIRKMLQDSERSWSTDHRDWWLGLSCFIGMNLAIADCAQSQIGLVTRGLKHFFRWRRGRHELLGLSLGASLIHPATQGHSVPKESSLYPKVGRRDHAPYYKTEFLYARGGYEFHYGICPGSRGESGRQKLWRAAQEFALPACGARASAAVSRGVRCSPSEVVISALEPRQKGLVLRLVNLSGKPVVARVRLPFDIASASGDSRPTLDRSSGILRVPLKPHALREITIRPQPLSG